MSSEDGLDPQVVYTPEEFPLYYQGAEQFHEGSVASGNAGATASVLIEVNNYPHIVYGFRITNSYELPPEFAADPANYDFKQKMLEGGIDEDQLVRQDLAQQNVTADLQHQRNLVGHNGINWHPYPVPYLFRGGNQVRFELIRLSSYPRINDGATPPNAVTIAPTVHITLVTGVLVSDRFPAKGPPSTDADDFFRRG